MSDREEVIPILLKLVNDILSEDGADDQALLGYAMTTIGLLEQCLIKNAHELFGGEVVAELHKETVSSTIKIVAAMIDKYSVGDLVDTSPEDAVIEFAARIRDEVELRKLK